jgi:hypothetical protein
LRRPADDSKIAIKYDGLYHLDSYSKLCARDALVDVLCKLDRNDEAKPLVEEATHVRDTESNTVNDKIKAVGSYWLGRDLFNQDKSNRSQDYFERVTRLLGGPRKRAKINRFRCDARHFVARIRVKNRTTVKRLPGSGDLRSSNASSRSSTTPLTTGTSLAALSACSASILSL